MATDADIILLNKKVRDNDRLQAAFDALDLIYQAGFGEVDILIKSGSSTFSLRKLAETLEANGAEESTMIDTIANDVLDLVGPDGTTANTIRKAIADLQTIYNGQIAAE